uniref:Xaa-Pro aminopeptidase 1 n=1 Tax=Clastoptera arizonana TaxID=38151 RepID=A0A1B6E280_9HEMI
MSEYLAPCDERRAFISGFTGSDGTAIITENAACVWTDGRYFLQASQEMDDNWTLMKNGVSTTPTQSDWLIKTLPAGSRVGVDPMYLSYREWTKLNTDLDAASHSLVPVTTNLIDLIWDDRPQTPNFCINPLPLKYTGRTSQEKVDSVRAQMEEKGVSLTVITALDEVAYLLNLRGSDIDYNPVFFSYVAITPSEVNLFIDTSKITQSVFDHFKQEDLEVSFHSYNKVVSYITEQVGNKQLDGKVWISHGSSSALVMLIPEKLRVLDTSAVALMKAIKNPVEIQGLINAHIRDAAALCCYFSWLEREVHKGNITEISGANKLEEFRKEQEDFVGLSFSTISSVGPNGAIIHYEPTPATDRTITTEELYLCDSGAQYKDGTTDVTRTLHFGTPTDYEKECFTRVFKGQMNLGTAVFPNKIKGNCLDTLARKSLWDVGLDYMHGTGHGIGAYLNVHEGPMGISWRAYPDDPGLQLGMFLSNEPGYYEDGKFGIRLENIVQIVNASTPYNYKNIGFLTFETITLVPIQTKMLVPHMLTEKEITCLNDYHSLCREKVGPLLKKMGHIGAYEWLYKETEPIG